MADRHADLKRKRRDFPYRLSASDSQVYDFLAVDNLDATAVDDRPGNPRKRTGTASGPFLRTRVSTDKPL
ncbi:transposase, IS605 OrfB family protein [Halovivax asiaticus JCM 14624]|uniref:Transposase, IS605 OrfB family protein n=1 Tax=Halovivax asiaticus JCM 14624 TaxID=1227490 RepID=M0BDK0_9EURY|nr:transposase, IS605 OrfB family protein [Halovivax asiaticus JCM 14624]